MKRKHPYPTQERVRELFQYHCDYGVLYLLTRRNRFGGRGRTAGSPTARGDTVVMVDRVYYNARDLVWIWHYGEVPEGGIKTLSDHPNDMDITKLVPKKLSERQKFQQQQPVQGISFM